MIRFCHNANSWQRLNGWVNVGDHTIRKWQTITPTAARMYYDSGCKVSLS